MIEAIPPDAIYWAASLAGTAALSLLAGREWGRRALRVAPAAGGLVEAVCDAVADGRVTPEEAEEIGLAVRSVIAAAQEPDA